MTPVFDSAAFDGGSVGGTNYWTPEDRRPTKAEARKDVDKFRKDLDDIVEFWESIPPEILDTEALDTNIPWWVKAPFYVAPYVADVFIEVDPLDRLED